MRLSTIKISGFKSFVDPTIVHLPTQLTAIVGPNGCGKSNIIDAVRWVMGESAASRLRGDQLADVIFSGSGSRKPVGSASVELVFDNGDGALGGEYARFAEVSVKRTVSRDGFSVYSINGSQCRRKDVIDLFLGTGLGARSYSIIEQGMISALIEAHPEELRQHLEEAAGISKYKERRKETEARIRDTRDNLARLEDLRRELARQVDHLERQAKAAERYLRLQQERARVEGALRALALAALHAEREVATRELKDAELTGERLATELLQAEHALEQERGLHRECGDALSAAQAQSFRIAGDIASLEQQIRHARELGQRLEQARRDTVQHLARLGEAESSDRERLAALEAELAAAEPARAGLVEEVERARVTLHEAELALGEWQQRWDRASARRSDALRAVDVERTRVAMIEERLETLARRRRELEEERARIDLAPLAGELERLAGAAREWEARTRQLEEAITAGCERIEAVARDERGLEERMAEIRGELESARGRLASLEALQHAALGHDDAARESALAALGWGSGPRLGELLCVEPGYERAVEAVLEPLLAAAVGEGAEALIARLPEGIDCDLALVDAGGERPACPLDSLAAKVEGPAAVLALLARVRIAQDAASARERLGQLPPGEAVVTPEGLWLVRGAVRIAGRRSPERGVLARERELRELRAQVAERERLLATLAAELADCRGRKAAAEAERQQAERALAESHRARAELAGALRGQQGRVEAARIRAEQIARELEALVESGDEARRTGDSAQAALQRAQAEVLALDEECGRLQEERRALRERLETARAAARDASDRLHQLDLRLESRRASAASLREALARLAEQRRQLEEKRVEIAAQLAAGETPLATLEQRLQGLLDERLRADRVLAEAQRRLEQAAERVRSQEHARHRVDLELKSARERIAEARLGLQAVELRAQTLREAIGAAGQDADALLQALPPDADERVLQSELEEIDGRIRRLGAINLAAIDELAEAAGRKQYLDAQHLDLTTALETLEQAIRKIDRETRARFEETFARVNAGLKELFPRLFGGGDAYLELVGEDPLSAGVTMMARPPGKRVSRISLLSGGEKALAAVALIFSIFRLNPSPFCMLDEVDAPLDEANVGRFCDLLREMSEKVQFVVVTHNRLTMESAHQLIGVTMREPGVSRLVSVDVAEAAALAGVA
jgi:chromosome segregation protein